MQQWNNKTLCLPVPALDFSHKFYSVTDYRKTTLGSLQTSHVWPAEQGHFHTLQIIASNSQPEIIIIVLTLTVVSAITENLMSMQVVSVVLHLVINFFLILASYMCLHGTVG